MYPGSKFWLTAAGWAKRPTKPAKLDLVVRNPDDPSRPCKKLHELKNAFAESNLPILVDVLDWARIPSDFRKEIDKEHVTIQHPDSEHPV